MTRLRTHHLVLIGLGGAIAAVTACSSPEAPASEDAKKSAQASSVAIEVLDENGSSLGSCSGTAIAPKIVLTAGHCVAGAKSWSVTNGSTTVKGIAASTSWRNFGSDLSHPEHSDVGLIMLDKEFKLSSYPALATKAAKTKATVTRYHRNAITSKAVVGTTTTINPGDDQGFKLDYLADAKDDFLDTGGAVIDNKGAIVGVVSGRGKASNMLHIARVDGFSTWSKKAIACSSGETARDWGGGYGGGGGWGGGGGGGADDGSGGWGGGGLGDLFGGWGGGGGGGWGGGGGGSQWGASSGGYGGGGGLGNGEAVLDGGAFVPGSGGVGGPGLPGPGDTVGGTGGPGSPGNGVNGSTGAPGTPGANTVGADAAPNTCPGIPTCEGEACGTGSNGLNGGTGSNVNPSGPNLTSGSATGSGTNGNPNTVGGSSSGFDTNNGGTSSGGTSGNGVNGGSGTSSGGTSGNGTNGTNGGSGTSSGGTSGNGTNGGSGTSSGGTSGNGTNGGSGTSGQPGTGAGEGCTGNADNPETCPTAPDSASCNNSHCGGCGGIAGCSDNNVDFGGIATTSGSGPVVK